MAENPLSGNLGEWPRNAVRAAQQAPAGWLLTNGLLAQTSARLLKQPRYPTPDRSRSRALRPVALRPHFSMGLPIFATMHKGRGQGKEVQYSFNYERI